MKVPGTFAKSDTHMKVPGTFIGCAVESGHLFDGKYDISQQRQRSRANREGVLVWPGFQGRKIASCTIFDQYKLTVAIPPEKQGVLPFGTRVLLENPANGREVGATVTDTGGFAKYGRDLDVARAVAQHLGFVQEGTARLRMVVLWKPLGSKSTVGASSRPPACMCTGGCFFVRKNYYAAPPPLIRPIHPAFRPRVRMDGRMTKQWGSYFKKGVAHERGCLWWCVEV